MDNSDENECHSSFSHIAEETSMINNTLPETSKKRYEDYYDRFMTWRQENNVQTFSENVLVAYFKELSEKYKSSSLWTVYSMLKLTINLKHNVRIECYVKLKTFLKKVSENYQGKKSKTLTAAEIHKFIKEAPDKKFLIIKVALVIALTGSCGINKLCKLKIEDIEDLNSAFLIKIPDPKRKVARPYTITGQFYEMCKKYLSLRPPNCEKNRFFLNYQNGKCTCHVVGIHRFGAMSRQIASFLNLPNPEEYTAHCFRRSSTTLLVGGDDLVMLKRHGGWTSNAVAQGFKTVDSLKQKQPEFMEFSVPIKDPLNIGSSSENFCVTQNRIGVKKEPDFIDIKQETDEDQVMQIYLQDESRIGGSDRPHINGAKQETDSAELDFIDLMFLDFAKEFKQVSARTQIKVKDRICHILAEAKINDFKETGG